MLGCFSRPRVLIHGDDGIGWSISHDNRLLREILDTARVWTVRYNLFASIVHSLWWTNYVATIGDTEPRGKVLLTASNFIDPNDDRFFLHTPFSKARCLTNFWIAPSRKQQKVFDGLGLTSFRLPFLIPQHYLHAQQEVSRKELLKRFGIPNELVEGRLIVGSFQRDSSGENLHEPRWQKNPQLLVDALMNVDKDKFLLLLVGPRRHYLIRKCQLYGIPYYYLGEETTDDDLLLNSLDYSEMIHLYDLIDIYLMTSAFEGGPKSVLESAARKKLILATDVGLAGDFLHPETVFKTAAEYTKAVKAVLENWDGTSVWQESMKDYAYARCLEDLSAQNLTKRIESIYAEVIREG